MREVTVNYYGYGYSTRVERAIQRRLARQVQVRNHILLLMAIFFITLLLAFMVGGFLSQASDENRATYKYFKSIEVESGDTLWSIATEYKGDYYNSTKAYVNEVKQMNHLTSDNIKAGQYLMIPYYSNEFK